MRTAAVLCVVFAGTLAGCGGGSEWDRQLAAVRGGRADAIILTAGRVTVADLADLRGGCTNLRRLTLRRPGPGPPVCDGTDFTAALGDALAGLPGLERLDFDGPLDPARLAVPPVPPPLTTLSLPAVTLDSPDLAALAAAFPRLRSLRVRDLRVGPEVAAGGAPPGFRHLHLTDAPLTDGEVAALADRFPSLDSLYLDGTTTTPAGRAELARRRPGLHLHFDGGH